MKIHAITHSGNNASKSQKNNVPKCLNFRKINNDPLATQKEYIRALNATKIERLLAKPFSRNQDALSDGIIHLSTFDNFTVCASYDNDLSVKKFNDTIMLTNVPNLCDVSIDNELVYIAADSKIHILNFSSEAYNNTDAIKLQFKNVGDFKNKNISVMNTIDTQDQIQSICVKKHKIYALTNSYCRIIDENYNVANQLEFQDMYRKIRENNNIIYCLGDSNLDIFDEQSNASVISKKFGIKTNDIVFKDKTYFVTANEDSFLYLHDIRKLESTVSKYIGHVNAVTSVDYVKNEIISGSADKTIRIFNCFDRTSRDVYYNKRMLSVNKVCIYKEKYILSGSDDGNVRLWRLNSSYKENTTRAERLALEENQVLKEKYYYVGDIKRIDKHRFLPGELKGKIKNETEHYKAMQRKKRKNENEK